MKFAIITHVIHKKHGHQYLAYAPYVREMNVWGKYVEEVLIVAPLQTMERTAVDSTYQHTNIRFLEVPTIHLNGVAAQMHAFLNVPSVLFQIYKAMSQADHIHLRCPGNMGLLGCFVQLVFPHKPKTAKYAGNWDPNAKQPWSYRFQKWLLSNTFLTRNMQVLAYGEWEGSTKNMHPFFTASYSEIEKQPLQQIVLQGTLRFVFVGTLSKGKQPLYAIQLVEALFKKGYAVNLALYGEGAERPILEAYILANTLATMISLKGNQDQETVTQAYQNSHFV
ncbi:MAG: glycosyltransferase family 1 protein, partial [Flavobacterium sp.]